MKINSKFNFLFQLVMFFLISNFSFLITDVYGDTHTATSLSSSDVQAAINAASNGDTVIMPAGTNTWSSGVTITNKGIILQGAGMDQTVIVDNTSTGVDPITLTNTTDNFLRITGFTIRGTGISGAGMEGAIYLNDVKYCRIDHVKFYNEGRSLYFDGHAEGLMDHCESYLNESKSVGTGGSFPLWSSWWITNPPSAKYEELWKRPLSLGTSNAFYVEDCSFDINGNIANSSGLLAPANCDRFVVRHNSVYGPIDCLENYWAGYGPTCRSAASIEIYSNTFNYLREGDNFCYMFRFDGGTGIFFDNAFTTTDTGWAQFFCENNRAWTALNPGGMYNGKCDGTSPIDGNTPVESGTHTGSSGASTLACSGKSWTANQWVGYAVRNLTDTGTSTAFYTPRAAGLITANTVNTVTATLTQGSRNNWNAGDSFIITDGYPCLDQVGRGPGPVGNQSAQPVYEWNNTINGTAYHLAPRNAGSVPDSKHIKANRDYYNCSSQSDAVSKGMVYTPYTYPHPLQGGNPPVDTTAPGAPGTVRDGTGTSDINSTASTTQLSANWTAATDNQSGISGYKYAIGTTAGGTQTAAWTALGNVLTVTRTGLSLAAGTTYYFSVKAVNGASLEGSAANSNGQFVTGDATPPSAPATVRDGTGTTDISSTTSRTQLSANWTAATDNESAITNYQYAIGTTAGGINTLGWQTLGNVLTITKTGLTLTVGTTYYFSVKAVNGAGLTGAVANSDGQVVLSTAAADTTPPSAPGTVRDGAVAGTDAGFTYSTATLSANWTASADAESGIANYQYAIGTTAGGTNVANWATIGNVLTITKTGLTLTIGATYYFSVKAANGAGLTGSATNSNGQFVRVVNTGDTTEPAAVAAVRDGTSATADFGSADSTAELSANWDASTDAESGITGYLYAIGTSPGATNITNWKNNGPLTEVTETGLTLAVGTTYYFSVKAENGVGLQSAVTNSDGQYVGQAMALQISNIQKSNITQSGATITWGTNIPATSKVEYGATVSYGDSVEDTGLVTSHGVSLTGLAPGVLYHFRVVSRDAALNEAAGTDDTFTTAPAGGEDVRAYPNPYSLSSPGGMKFNIGAPAGGEVKIYTLSGKLVRKLTAQPGATEISWDGTNENNEKVTRGIYIYTIISTDGDKKTGKLAVVR